MAELLILDAAEDEYLAAARWYGERSSVAAEGFMQAVALAFQRIIDRPEWGASCDAVHRQVIVRGYPYRVVYRELGTDRVVVIAIAHGSRRPGYWTCR